MGDEGSAAMEANDRATPAAAGATTERERPAGWESWSRNRKKYYLKQHRGHK